MKKNKMMHQLMAGVLTVSMVLQPGMAALADETVNESEIAVVQEVDESELDSENELELAPEAEDEQEDVQDEQQEEQNVQEAAPIAAPLNDAEEGTSDAVEIPEDVEEEVKNEDPILQNGEVLLFAGSSKEDIKDKLGKALVSNAAHVDLQSLEWEYKCSGKSSTGLSTNTAWGSIDGFKSTKKSGLITTTYTHPSLLDNAEGEYSIRLKGTTTEVKVKKVSKLTSAITLNDGQTIGLVYNEDATVDYDAVEQKIFDNVVAETTPELSVNDVTIEYYAKATTGSAGSIGQNWISIKGGKVGLLTYPAMGEGSHKIRISYAGTNEYKAVSAETTISVTDRENASIELNEECAVKLIFNEDLTVDYEALKQQLFKTVVADTTPELGLEDVTIEYYATAETGALGSIGKAWAPIEGAKISGLIYPAIPEGTQKVRFSFKGNSEYKGTSAEVSVEIVGRPAVEVVLNEAPYEVALKYNTDQTINYEATKNAIIEAVIASSEPELTADQIHVAYNASMTDLIPNYQPIDSDDWTTTLKKFGIGVWSIRLSWDATTEYKAGSVDVTVNVDDKRTPSAVVCKTGAAFTYNMDAAVMKQAIFDQVIDWENSTLPAKEEVSVDDFEMQYYATSVLPGNISGIQAWAPIEGADTILGSYPNMGAGEQQIRIAYKGNTDFRPSEKTEAQVTVNKANVKVKVNSASIFADAPVPDNFVTTDPADQFDIYTIYAGVTRNITTAIYLDLPDRYTNSAVLKILDPVVEKIYGKSFTQMINDGMTVGELKELLSADELLELLEKLNIDLGTFGQIIKVINQMPSLVDSVRVSFGTPNRAGTYTVAAVTDNKNYNTGVGIGMLLVKAHYQGVKLSWNSTIPGNKLTQAEAAEFDFGATVSYNGNSDINQDNVHYLYSGFTSKWRPYSSTTTPPTEPGSYVVTVVTLGGNYQAAPITRTFKITK